MFRTLFARRSKVVSAADIELLHKSPLLDPVWYRRTYADLREKPIDAARHYLEHGAREGRNPHPLFDTKWYLARISGDRTAQSMNPLVHYLRYGASQGHSPHPLFEIEWYLDQTPAVRLSNAEPISHYLREGWRLNLSPHPLFDPLWYRRAEPAADDLNPLLHYILTPPGNHKSTHPKFDSVAYAAKYQDIESSGLSPLEHYLRVGWRQGRWPNDWFDPSSYPNLNATLKESGEEPLTHYVKTTQRNGASSASLANASASSGGAEEQKSKNRESPLSLTEKNFSPSASGPPTSRYRKIIRNSGLFDEKWYLRTYKDVARANVDAFEHFVQYGFEELRSPGPSFDARWYVAQYPEARSSGMPPLVHYLTVGRDQGFEPVGNSYQVWYKKFDSVGAEDVSLIESDIGAKSLPFLQVIIHIDRASEGFAVETIQGIERQIFRNWRALVLLSKSCSSKKISQIEELVRGNYRFTVVRDSDDSYEVSQKDCVVVVSGGVLVREHAFYMFALAAAQNPNSRLIYSDEDRLVGGNRESPTFKPQYSPILAKQTNYYGHCFLIRSLERSVFDLKLALRDGSFVIERLLDAATREARSDMIANIPFILFHDMLVRSKPLRPIELPDRTETLPSYTIIIPTKNGLELLKPCIESIEERSDYPKEKIEIIVVDNASDEESTLAFLAEASSNGRAKVIRDDGRFNFSRLNNTAAKEATHDVLLFLNNDTIVDDRLWLRRIGYFVSQRGVAAVGGKLLFPDRTIQHGGVILGVQGVAAHDLVGLKDNDPEARIDMTREISAVTGACLAIRREIFKGLGGFDMTTAVAFNDTLLCLTALKAGYRNVYIKEPLLIHYESKSRGYDDAPERVALFQREARYARSRHNKYFKDDPYYSPNLCLQRPNELAFPPRCAKPWRIERKNRANLKILFLSSTCEVGHGVAVVISLQAAYLRDRGYEIFVGGPKGRRELPFPGCHRVFLEQPADAAAYAVEQGIDCIVVETPPFFSVARWLGDWPRTLFLDHGEPPAEFFDDAGARRQIAAEKRLCSVMASDVFAISESVRGESGEERARVIANGNSHLVVWNDSVKRMRAAVRTRLGWSDKAVVLNVCRFTGAERRYKGLDRYTEVLQEFQFARPKLAAQTVFALCGKAEPQDVAEMKKTGLDVFENVTETEMVELYAAADVYANFSRWEGYNLGIGQALALGLPVVASDIPPHRAFPIFTSNAVMPIVERLSDFIETAIVDGFSAKRVPFVADWKDSLAKLEHAIVELCRVDGRSVQPEREERGAEVEML